MIGISLGGKYELYIFRMVRNHRDLYQHGKKFTCSEVDTLGDLHWEVVVYSAARNS